MGSSLPLSVNVTILNGLGKISTLVSVGLDLGGSSAFWEKACSSYENQMPQVVLSHRSKQLDDQNELAINEQVVPQPISITYGYSRDHRPDLKQFILDLICSGDGDVPLFLRVADGDESDQAVFAKICGEFKQQLNLEALMVADSALCSAPNSSADAGIKLGQSSTFEREIAAPLARMEHPGNNAQRPTN